MSNFIHFPRQELIYEKFLNHLYMQVQILRRSRKNGFILKTFLQSENEKSFSPGKGRNFNLQGTHISEGNIIILVYMLISREHEGPSSVCGHLTYIKKCNSGFPELFLSLLSISLSPLPYNSYIHMLVRAFIPYLYCKVFIGHS